MLHADGVEGDATEQAQGAAAQELLEHSHEATQRQEPLRTHDSQSQISKRTNGSSTTSSAAIRARAKSKAALAQLTFAEREADMIRKKAELEASLHVLTTQKMAAAAEAEAAAYEEEEIESGEKHQEPYVPGKPFSAFERAGNYVQQHSAMFGREPPPTDAPLHSYKPAAHHSPIPLITNIKKEEPSPCKSPPVLPRPSPSPHKGFLPMPQLSPSPHRGPSSEPQPAQDLAKYLMRREMVSSGLLQFDDRPDHFWSWKASFLSATQDLNLTSREELDLLSRAGAENPLSARPQSRGRPPHGVATCGGMLRDTRSRRRCTAKKD